MAFLVPWLRHVVDRPVMFSRACPKSFCSSPEVHVCRETVCALSNNSQLLECVLDDGETVEDHNIVRGCAAIVRLIVGRWNEHHATPKWMLNIEPNNGLAVWKPRPKCFWMSRASCQIFRVRVCKALPAQTWVPCISIRSLCLIERQLHTASARTG